MSRIEARLIPVVLLVILLAHCGGGSEPVPPPASQAGDASIVYSSGGAIEIFINDANGHLIAALGNPFWRADVLGVASTSDGLVSDTIGTTTFQGFVDVGNRTAGSPCPTVSVGWMPIALTYTPNKKFFYTGNNQSSDISALILDANGCMTSSGTVATDTGTRSIAVDRTSAYLYAATAGGGIDAFSIDPTSGALTRLSGAGFDSGTGTMLDLTASPTADLIFASDAGTSNVVHVLHINLTTGTLTPVPGSPFFTGGTSPSGMTLNPVGNLLFVANTDSDTISVFSVSSGGGLAPVSGSPFSGTCAPVGLRVDPEGKFLYIANAPLSPCSNAVAAYGISAAGALSPIDFTGNGAGITPRGPNVITLMPGVRYLPICTPNC